MSDVFISYSRRDQVFARRLFERIKLDDLEGWADWEGIPSGTEWKNIILRNIDAARNFVFIVSPDSLTSPVCHLELEHARNHNKRIIPIMRREPDLTEVAGQWYDKPFEQLARDNWELLKSLNWVLMRKKSDSAFDCEYDHDTRKVINEECDSPDSDADDFEAAFIALVEAVQTDQVYIEEHTRLLNKAIDWKQKRGGLLRDEELQQAEAWLLSAEDKKNPPTDEHRQYITTSRITANRQRRTLVAILSSLLVVAVIMAVLSLIGFQNADSERVRADDNAATSDTNALIAENNEATALAEGTNVANQAATSVAEADLRATAQFEAENAARIALSRQLAAQAINPSILEKDISQSLLMILQAIKLDSENLEARQNLVEVLTDDPHLESILWHENSVSTVAISPRDPLIVSGDGLGNLYFWDATTHRLLEGPVEGHDDVVRSIHFSSDGALFASIADGSTAIIWDAISREPAYQILDDFSGNVGVFTPNGRYLVAPSDEDSEATVTLRTWDVQSGEIIGNIIPLYGDEIAWNIAISPDSLYLAAPDNRTNEIVLWSIPDGEKVQDRSFVTTLDRIPAIAFSTDGETLVAGGCVLNFQTDNCQRSEVNIWDIKTGDMLTPPLIIAERQETEGTITGLIGVWRVAISPDGKTLAIVEIGGINGQNYIQLWDLDNFALLHEKGGVPNNQINAVAFAPDNSYFVASDIRNRVSIWRLGQQESVSEQVLKNDTTGGHATFDVSEDGSLLAASFFPLNEITLLNLETNETFRTIKTYHPYGVSALAIDPNKEFLAAAGIVNDGRVSVWDIETGAFLYELPREYTGGIVALDFNSNGSLLSVGENNGSVTVWNTESGEHIRTIDLSDLGIMDLEFVSAELLISRDIHGTIHFSDVNTGNRVRNPLVISAATFGWPLQTFTIDSKGEQVAAVTQQGLGVWDLFSHQQIAQFDVDGGFAPTLSADGSLLVVQDERGRLLIFDVINKSLVNDIDLETGINIQLKFNPATNRLYGAGFEGIGIRSWEIAPVDLFSRACEVANRDFSIEEWRQFTGNQSQLAVCSDTAGIAPGVVSQQDDSDEPGSLLEIEAGMSVTGEITPGEQDTWIFHGKEGDYSFISLISASSNGLPLDGVLSLYSPSGELIESYNDIGSLSASIYAFEILQDGEYTIVVSGDNQESSGAYTLSLALLDSTILDFNQPVSGYVEEDESRLWQVEINKPQRIAIIPRSDQTLSANYDIYRAADNRLVSSSSSRNPFKEYVISVPGTYFIRLGASGSGAFTLLVVDENQLNLLRNNAYQSGAIRSQEIISRRVGIALCHSGYTPLLTGAAWGVAWLQNISSQSINVSLITESDLFLNPLQSSIAFLNPRDIGFVALPSDALQGRVTAVNPEKWLDTQIEFLSIVETARDQSIKDSFDDLQLTLLSHHANRGMPRYLHHALQVQIQNTSDQQVEVADSRGLFAVYDENGNLIDMGYSVFETLNMESQESHVLTLESLSQTGSCVQQQMQNTKYEIWFGLSFKNGQGIMTNLFQIFSSNPGMFENRIIES